MLSDDEIRFIGETVAERYGEPHFRANSAALDDYKASVTAVLTALSTHTEASTDELALAVAAAVLGPDGAKFDSASVRPHLERLRALAANGRSLTLERLYEVVTAYGAEWGRVTTGSGWDGLWHGAIMALHGMVDAAVAKANAAAPRAGRNTDDDAALLFQWLQSPCWQVHERPSRPGAHCDLRVRLSTVSTEPQVEIFDPAWPKEPTLLPAGAVQTYDLESDTSPDAHPLMIFEAGAATSHPDVTRIVVRADGPVPEIHLIPAGRAVDFRRVALKPGGGVLIVAHRAGALQAWHCRCGSGQLCEKQHRLQAWAPTIPLAGFIERAVGTVLSLPGGRSMYDALCL